MPSQPPQPKRRAGRRPIDTDLAEPRTRKLFEALCGLLAKRDYDQVSLAELARRAGCSTGAIYVRFKNKDALLKFTLRHFFGVEGRRYETALRGRVKKRMQIDVYVSAAIGLLIETFLTRPFPGLVRASVKLSFQDPSHGRSLDRFREQVLDAVAAPLSDEVDVERIEEFRMRFRLLFGALISTAIDRSETPAPKEADLREILRGLLNTWLEDATKLDATIARVKIEPDADTKKRRKI